MKVAVLLLAFLLPVMSWAMPNIGDRAELSGTLTLNGFEYDLAVADELIDFNSSRNEYLRQSYSYMGGREDTVEEWVPGDQLMTRQGITELLTYCDQVEGGSKERITVPAGAFDTCKLEINDPGQTGFVWIGMAAFGVVKADVLNDDGQTQYRVQVELDKHSFGQ